MKKAVKDKNAMTLENIDATEKSGLASLALSQEIAEREVDAGYLSTKELINIQLDYENRRYQIQTAAQQARIDAMRGDPNYDPVALQKLLDQLTEIQNKHAMDVAKLNTQMSMDVKANWEGMLFPIRDAFDRTINGMIQGTLTWQRALINIGDNVAASFIKAGINMATAWAAAELRKTAATQTGTLMRLFLEKMGLVEAASARGAAAATSIGAAKAEAAMVIPAEAAIAAGGAAMAVAPIPIVGPALAAAAYAETMALVMSGLAVASAEGGYDIPAGLNPMTQLHEREMVLPAEHADTIRGLKGDSGDVHLHVHAVDAQSVKRLFMDNGRALAAALTAQRRNFYKPA
jgi:hypothetical protein